MFQVIFSTQSLDVLRRLTIPEQLELVDPLTKLKPNQLKSPREPLGKFTRDGKTLYRLHSKDYRIYFEYDGESLLAKCILHKNTLTDFVYRTKLPITDEQLIEQHSSFWKYLETLKH